MPLLPSVLEQGLQDLTDNPPENEVDAIIRHAAAFRRYMEGVTHATPLQHSLGEQAFIGAAQGQALSFVFIQAAYVAYCAALVVPPFTSPFTLATPPIGLPPLTPVAIPAYAAVVDTWVRTGTATIPPSAPVPWV